MNKQKLTPWFPADVKPAYKGVYELNYLRFRAFAYWDGCRFGWRCWISPYEPEGVSAAINEAFDMRRRETCLPAESEWRGLAEQPK